MDIVGNLSAVQERIIRSAIRAGRRPEEVTLVAVTKTWPSEVVVAGYQAGLRHFGENRGEELAGKRAEIETELGSDSGIVWHAIGALQSRKSNLVADHADVFHALDRLKIANRISQRLAKSLRAEQMQLPVFIEVNVSGEATKAGIDCSRWEEDSAQRENLGMIAEAVSQLPHLLPQGLMTMAPWQVESTTIRSVFRRVRLLSEWLQSEAPQAEWSRLSMGMTDDFELAIEEGATHVRVGRAIFGRRG
jgi:pyridoxal phosphate enzyme (YggS family)